jgi:hypothetical protein
MKRLPSVKSLMKHLLLTKEQAQEFRRIAKTESELEESGLNYVDSVSEWSFGVEYFEHKRHKVAYCNAGDTYRITLLKVNGAYRIGCWGDIAEK